MEYKPILILPVPDDFITFVDGLSCKVVFTPPRTAAPAAAPEVSMNFLRFMVQLL
jgi:hypothetical protein